MRVALDCPKCAVPMQEGSAVIHGTTLGILLIGFSWMKLFFRSSGARGWREDVEVQRPDERRQAHRCGKCGGVFVELVPWTAPTRAKS
jgi:hypothetical protein